MRAPSKRKTSKPLEGLCVLVTRPATGAAALSQRLRALGAHSVLLPTIQFHPPEDFSALDRAVRALRQHQYDWVIFTSAHGVKFFWDRLKARGDDARLLKGAKLAAIGPATARALEERGLHVDYVPRTYVAEEIARGIRDVAHCRILLPRADIARKALAQLLRDQGAQVDEVAVYCTQPAQVDSGRISHIQALLKEGKIDVVTFTSSSTVRQFLEWIEDASLLEDVTVACIGPITAATARELGLSVEIVAQEHTIDGLLQALLKGMSSHV
jgi:uroporphyrinogen III methyltransferase/synthase